MGAGTGATIGKLAGMERATKGGLGSASVRLGSGLVVGALVAVNAGGNVVDPSDGHVVAGVRDADGGFLDATGWLRQHDDLARGAEPPPVGNTTLAVVATDAVLTKTQTTKVAQMAHDGLARAIDPVHTMYDGDTVFALATGAAGRAADASVIGAVGARVLSQAVLNAVRAATTVAGIAALRDLTGGEPA